MSRLLHSQNPRHVRVAAQLGVRQTLRAEERMKEVVESVAAHFEEVLCEQSI